MSSRVWAPRLVAVMMAGALVGACSQEPNPEDRISRDLKSANIDEVSVDYDRETKVVHLKGAVDNPGEKSQAEDIAIRAVGTAGTVANELTIKGANEATADDMDGTIRSELNAKVDNDKVLTDRDINFDVNNGVVTVKGEVRNEAEKKQVLEMAKLTANVKDVVDALQINSRLAAEKR